LRKIKSKKNYWLVAAVPLLLFYFLTMGKNSYWLGIFGLLSFIIGLYCLGRWRDLFERENPLFKGKPWPDESWKQK
jgi:lysylphosphatidylglycerol synthetase-like protein (DUF2156 family)